MNSLDTIAKASEAAHWYLPTGEPLYSVPYADGRPGTRNATLADARKVYAVPSVTNVLSILRNFGLETWQRSQLIQAALTLPQEEGESLDDFALRVIEDADRQSREAREFGTRLHEAIANATTPGDVAPCDPDLVPFVDGFLEWYRNWAYKRIETEYAFASPRGFGGKVDWLGYTSTHHGICVVDWKTQGTKPGKTIGVYRSWGRQLAAYGWGLHTIGHKEVTWPILELLNVVVSSTEPGRVEVVTWSDQSNELLEDFNATLLIWRHEKGYMP